MLYRIDAVINCAFVRKLTYIGLIAGYLKVKNDMKPLNLEKLREEAAVLLLLRVNMDNQYSKVLLMAKPSAHTWNISFGLILLKNTILKQVIRPPG
jgi:hypothetical protein